MILVFFTFGSFLGHHIPALEFLKILAFSVLVSYKRVSYKKMSVSKTSSPPPEQKWGTVEEKPSNVPSNIFNLKNIWRRSDFLLFLLRLDIHFPKKCFNMVNIGIFAI